MLHLSDIRAGSQVILQLESHIAMELELDLNTKFETAHDDELFSITAPMWQGEYYAIPPGDVAHVSFFHEGIRQIFDAQFVDEYVRGSLSFVKLKRISPIIEIQLRDDFRLPMDGVAKITYDEQEAGETVERVRHVRLRDLSGGGVSFYTEWNLAEAEELRILFPLETATIELNVMVNRIEERPHDARRRYAVGAQFLFTSGRDKERIVSYVFKMQQKRIQEQRRKVK